jgi:peptidoglycan/LPS O-acetylase OafA/YrhL
VQSQNVKYIPAVDHLRGVAAILMIFYHGLVLGSYALRFSRPFGYDNWLQSNNPLLTLIIEGHTAVALFMCLSGFIFTYGSLGHDVNYGSFIRNRFLRIFPMFVTMLVVGMYTFPAKYTWLGMLQTLTFQSGPYMPGTPDFGAITALFWTISVEFQFYLIFPFLLRFLNRYGPIYLVGVIVLFTVFRALSGWMNYDNIRDLSYWTIVGRIDQFMCGMLIGWLYHRIEDRQQLRLLRVLFLPAVALVLAALWMFNRAGGWPQNGVYKIFWPTIEGGVWAFFIVCYLALARVFPKWLSRVLALPGAISYSTYLTHFMFVAGFIAMGYSHFTGDAVIDALINTLLIPVPLTLALSTLTYNMIERPFLRMRAKYVKA